MFPSFNLGGGGEGNGLAYLLYVMEFTGLTATLEYTTTICSKGDFWDLEKIVLCEIRSS